MKKYTLLQAFFWLVAGSEIHILRDCENDYNRHASIGFILFMTTIFASLSGFSAGYFFSNGNISISIFFAFLWSMLIYSIDRSMVVSLKKKTKIETLGFWGKIKHYLTPFLLRAIVGAMIGFFMSIPLEIVVFKDNIKIQIDDENKDRILKEVNFVNSINNLDYKKNRKIDSEQKKEELDSLLQTKCPLPEYMQAISDYNSCKSQADALNSVYLEAQKDMNQVQQFVWRDSVRYETQGYKNARYRRNKALTDYRLKIAICKTYNNKAKTISTDWNTELKYDREKADSTATALDSVILGNTREADSLRIVKEKMLEGLNGFTRQYEALTHAASSENNASLLFLLWLIRFIFIGIEILPMLTKLMTPIGDYDRAIETSEEKFEKHLSSSKAISGILEDERIKLETDISKETEAKRKELELALNGKVLDEVARVQAEIATEMLNEWERQEKEKISSRITDFIKSK
jgi:hypothetical protein